MLQDVINTYLSMYMQLLFAFLVHTYASFYDLFPDYMQICLKPCMSKGTIKWCSLCTFNINTGQYSLMKAPFSAIKKARTKKLN